MANPVLDNGRGSPHSVFSSNATAAHEPGTVGRLGKDVFTYALAGAADLAAGKVAIGPAMVADFVGMVCVATPAGGNVLNVTLGSTAATASQFAGGFVIVADDAGEAYKYTIRDHPAADAAAALALTLYDEVQVAVTTSTTVEFHAGTHRGCIIGAAGGRFAGIARGIITAAEYGWLQTGGIANVLADSTVAAGNLLTFGSATGGAVDPHTLALPVLGVAYTAIVDTEYGAIDLG